jgi:hypothetical protein
MLCQMNTIYLRGRAPFILITRYGDTRRCNGMGLYLAWRRVLDEIERRWEGRWVEVFTERERERYSKKGGRISFVCSLVTLIHD